MSTTDDAPSSHKRPRTHPIRRRIAMLLVIPLLSLVGLWGFSASITLNAALANFHCTTITHKIGLLAGTAAVAVQQERTAPAVVLGSRGRQGRQQLRELETTTDAACRRTAFSSGAKGALSRTVTPHLLELNRQFDRLGTLRSRVGAASISPLEAIDEYSDIFDSTNQLLINIVSADDVGIYQRSNAMLNANWSRDYMLREDSLIAAVQAAGGRMTAAQHAAFTDAASNRRHSLDVALASLSGEVRGVMQQVTNSPEFSRYQALEEGIATHPGATSARTFRDWRANVQPLSSSWWQQEVQAEVVLSRQSGSLGDRTVLQLALAGGLGLLAVGASGVLSVVFVRALSRELGGLQRAAQNLARERLPRVVARLRRGEEVDVGAEVPQFSAGRTREISLVADAFTTVQRTAVDTAVGEAHLRNGISRVGRPRHR